MAPANQQTAPKTGLTQRARLFYWLAMGGTALWVVAGIVVLSMFPHKLAAAAQDLLEEKQMRTAWVEQTYILFFEPVWLVINWVLLPALFAYGVWSRLQRAKCSIFGSSASTGAKVWLLFATYAEIVKTMGAAVSFAWLWAHASETAIPRLKLRGDQDLMKGMTADGTAYGWVKIGTIAGFVAGLLETLVIWNLTLGDDAANFGRLKDMYTLAKENEDLEQEEQAQRTDSFRESVEPFVRKV